MPNDTDLSLFLGSQEDLCPICLDPMPILTFKGTERRRLLCCGKFTCPDCGHGVLGHQAKVAQKTRARMQNSEQNNVRDLQESKKELEQSMACPVCRAQMPTSPKRAFEMTLENAEKGHAWAQHSVGTKYESGSGVAPNPTKAAQWFKRAALHGHPWAMSSYGHCLRDGNGVSPDIKEAVAWFKKSAALGHAISQYYMADVLLNGTGGMAKDKKEAVRLLNLSAAQGHDPAQCLLGNCHEFVNGVPKRDMEKALFWYTRAAEQGNVTAMNNVGATLMAMANEKYGSVEVAGKSPIPRALKWARKAAAAGDADSMRVVAQIEAVHSGMCANCRKEKPSGGCNLLRCSKCKCMHYCSKDCQVKHWKDGHKKDCCS